MARLRVACAAIPLRMGERKKAEVIPDIDRRRSAKSAVDKDMNRFDVRSSTYDIVFCARSQSQPERIFYSDH